MSLYSKWLEKRAAKRAEIEKGHKRQIDTANSKLGYMRGTMRSSWCPFIQADCMGANCVHYNPGFIAKLQDGDKLHVSIIGPNCKLWK